MKKIYSLFWIALLFLFFGFTNIANAQIKGSFTQVQAGLNGHVSAFIVYNDELYLGGSFTSPAKHFAKWNGTDFTALDSNAIHIHNFAVFRNELYAVGYFEPGIFVAKWNGSSWVALGTPLNDEAYSIGVYNDELYVGGAFTNAGNSGANYIAKWNGSSWKKAGTLDSNPEDFIIYNNEFYALGGFTEGIAKWTGTSWQYLNYSKYKTPITSVIYNNDLYIAGGIQYPSGARISKYDGVNFSEFGEALNGQVKKLIVF